MGEYRVGDRVIARPPWWNGKERHGTVVPTRNVAPGSVAVRLDGNKSVRRWSTDFIRPEPEKISNG